MMSKPLIVTTPKTGTRSITHWKLRQSNQTLEMFTYITHRRICEQHLSQHSMLITVLRHPVDTFYSYCRYKRYTEHDVCSAIDHDQHNITYNHEYWFGSVVPDYVVDFNQLTSHWSLLFQNLNIATVHQLQKRNITRGGTKDVKYNISRQYEQLLTSKLSDDISLYEQLIHDNKKNIMSLGSVSSG